MHMKTYDSQSRTTIPVLSIYRTDVLIHTTGQLIIRTEFHTT